MIKQPRMLVPEDEGIRYGLFETSETAYSGTYQLFESLHTNKIKISASPGFLGHS